MRGALAAALLLGGCQAAPEAGSAANDAGSRLEKAAVAAGLVIDPAGRSITGSWANDTDRLCVVPGVGEASRLGVLIDYGAGLGCAGSGTVIRKGNGLAVNLGADCRFMATFDGQHIAFPADVPSGCDQLCTGRATLSALRVGRLGTAVSEAANLRTPSGRALCGG